MSLRDFKPDESDFDPETSKTAKSKIPLEGSEYREEINTLKIDKLANRVTIISVIIPCLISAILVFAYLDIKERVVDFDQTKNTQVERMSQQFGDKLNALDVKVAKNRFDLDKELPELSSKQTALEGKLSKALAQKADNKDTASKINSLKNALDKQAKVSSTLSNKVERVQKNLDTVLSENKKQLETASKQIQDDINLFKEEFDARLAELAQYQEQIGELGKNYSLMDKKIRSLEQESVTAAVVNQKIADLKETLEGRISTLEGKVTQLNKQLTANFTRLQSDVDTLMKTNTPSGPKPQINLDNGSVAPIEEEPLNQ